jgi:hypothetical protein
MTTDQGEQRKKSLERMVRERDVSEGDEARSEASDQPMHHFLSQRRTKAIKTWKKVIHRRKA